MQFLHILRIKETIMRLSEIAPSLYQDVARLDPLHADGLFRILPHLNASAHDVGQLVQVTKDYLPGEETLHTMSSLEAMAILRDLGMLASSLRRHGMEPREYIPGLERIFLMCGEKAGTVPRDTVFSYGPQNPPGERQRRFTPLSEERMFIASFTECMFQLDLAIDLLLQAKNTSIADPTFAPLCERSLQAFELLTKGMVEVRRNISAATFTFVIRPYFDPYQIGGRLLAAPGGTQIPILLIDQILWGSGCEDSTYQDYLVENIFYTLAKYRTLSHMLVGQVSLVQLAEQEMLRYNVTDSVVASLHALRTYLNRIMAFRYVHLAAARDSFALRSETDSGSGGYKLDILDFLLRKTQYAKHAIDELLNDN
jgi:hypothetical protein